MSTTKIRVVGRRNPRRSLRKLRRRVYIPRLSSYTLEEIIDAINQPGQVKTAEQLRTNLRNIVNNDKFWDKIEELAVVTKQKAKLVKEFEKIKI